MKFIELKDYYKLLEIADKKMKQQNGHQFATILKTRCQLCGRSPKQKGKCSYWLKTLLDNLYYEISKIKC